MFYLSSELSQCRGSGGARQGSLLSWLRQGSSQPRRGSRRGPLGGVASRGSGLAGGATGWGNGLAVRSAGQGRRSRGEADGQGSGLARGGVGRGRFSLEEELVAPSPLVGVGTHQGSHVQLGLSGHGMGGATAQPKAREKDEAGRRRRGTTTGSRRRRSGSHQIWARSGRCDRRCSAAPSSPDLGGAWWKCWGVEGARREGSGRGSEKKWPTAGLELRGLVWGPPKFEGFE
jgi:hypothetical protein